MNKHEFRPLPYDKNSCSNFLCSAPESDPIHQVNAAKNSLGQGQGSARIAHPALPYCPYCLYCVFCGMLPPHHHPESVCRSKDLNVAATPTPLCPVHQYLEDRDNLEMQIGGNNCVACSLNERAELLNILAPFAGGSLSSVDVLREVVAFYDTHYGANRVVVSYPAPIITPCNGSPCTDPLHDHAALLLATEPDTKDQK